MKRFTPYLVAAMALAIGALSVDAMAASDKEKQQVFQATETYTTNGTVTRVNEDDVEISRDNMPSAEFTIVEEQTEVMVDGSKASHKDLKPGMQVRTQFQVAGDEIIATRIEAMSEQPGAMPGEQPGSESPESYPYP